MRIFQDLETGSEVMWIEATSYKEGKVIQDFARDKETVEATIYLSRKYRLPYIILRKGKT